MAGITESTIEETTLGWFSELGFSVLHGPDIAPGEPAEERESYQEVILSKRFQQALQNLNPDIPAEALEDAFRKVTRPESPSLIQNNRVFHRMLVDGVDVEYKRADGSVAGDKVRLIDFDHPDNNWLTVNQFTVVEGQHNRRPDVVVFVNGLPLAVIELKNPADEEATIGKAFNQLQTYKQEISSLFTYNELLVISDGLGSRIGSLTANWEWFLPWRTIEGEKLAPDSVPGLEVLIKGVFEKSRFLQLIRHFIVFEEDISGNAVKKIAGYHQFHAVEKGVETTVKASRPGGSKQCGVVWHTQGSGKSLTMVFFAGRIILHPTMENPTLLVLTDRIDLDNQLFGTFSRCHELLRQNPVQAENRSQLRELLKVACGGVVFSTVQKFFPEEKGDSFPELSKRRNIVVIADEAHRSQYDFIDGFAKHMRDALPNASFIGFTGTPLELTDKNTRQVFGDYIDIYDIERAVKDGATVPIFYEGRLAKLELNESERPNVDPKFEEVTEGEEAEKKEKLKTKWAALEAVVGTEKRIGLIARDLVNHFEERLNAMEGKAMIVCMSRRICVEMYNALVRLRPEWEAEEDDKGFLKVVMTGSASDDLSWQKHIRTKERRDKLANRFKDPADPFKVAIVRDMWLTGFDVPCLHTMYVDKPMRGHGLMQAIARVNRVYKDKPGGLVVDYIGLAYPLKLALKDYTESGGKGQTAIDQDQAVGVLLEKYEICCDLFHGFDWSPWIAGDRETAIRTLANGVDFILNQLEDGKARCIQAVTKLSQAFALAVPHEKALEIRDGVAFFQAVKAQLVKKTLTQGKPEWELEQAIRQLVSKAVATDEILDIFSAVGLKKSNISILSDEFLEEVRNLPQRNLAVELLRRLLNDEIRTRSKKNVVQARSFADRLAETILKYQNRTIETARVIAELIELAKEMREAVRRGEDLKLSEEELAFYDALEVNDSAVKVLGDEILKNIAKELAQSLRKNYTIDWTLKESARAKLRVLVKRILKKYGYPPDKQEQATKTVLEQAELYCTELAA